MAEIETGGSDAEAAGIGRRQHDLAGAGVDQQAQTRAVDERLDMEVAVLAGPEGDRTVRVGHAASWHQLAQQARSQLVLEAVADDERKAEAKPDGGVTQLLERLAADGEHYAAPRDQKPTQEIEELRQAASFLERARESPIQRQHERTHADGGNGKPEPGRSSGRHDGVFPRRLSGRDDSRTGRSAPAMQRGWTEPDSV